MANDQPLDFEIHGNTAVLCLNRPEVHNSVNAEMMAALEQRLDAIEANRDIRAIILTGAGSQTFCAGGDIRYFATLKTRESCLLMSLRMQAILQRLKYGNRVVIAAVNGQALGGGCEMITACHIRIAASHAEFSFRQAPNGIITGWGGGKRLIRLLGKTRALRLFLAGERINAQEALRIGLVDQVVEPEMLLLAALDLAKRINQNSRAAVEAFLELAALSETADWETVRKFETEKFADLWVGEDFQSFVKRYLNES
jgi:enoyl-CoA hydratase/carnithine racemase